MVFTSGILTGRAPVREESWVVVERALGWDPTRSSSMAPLVVRSTCLSLETPISMAEPALPSGRPSSPGPR